jgi:adenine-specific DNA methylase
VPALLLNRSAEQLPLAAASVDAVVTDPPYFDNVMYSELVEFYYVWLRQFLAGDYCQFEPAYGDRAREAVTDPAGPRRAAHYREVLQSVFTECRRVLKPGAPMICTFHHGAAEAWITLVSAVLAAGFGLVEFFSA